jgi:hypothetical protein
MPGELRAVVKGVADDVTKSLSEDMGPTLEGFSRQTGKLLEDSAKAYDDCEQSIANNIRDVMSGGEGDLNPGALGEGGSGAPRVGEPGTGDLSGAPSGPVTDNGVGPCGKAGAGGCFPAWSTAGGAAPCVRVRVHRWAASRAWLVVDAGYPRTD